MRPVIAGLDLAPLPVGGADPPHDAEHEDHEAGDREERVGQLILTAEREPGADQRGADRQDHGQEARRRQVHPLRRAGAGLGGTRP